MLTDAQFKLCKFFNVLRRLSLPLHLVNNFKENLSKMQVRHVEKRSGFIFQFIYKLTTAYKNDANTFPFEVRNVNES